MPKQAENIGGTTANLRSEELYSIWDLIHGAMLPSGNDAAFTLAEFFGQILQNQSKYIKMQKELYNQNRKLEGW